MRLYLDVVKHERRSGAVASDLREHDRIRHDRPGTNDVPPHPQAIDLIDVLN